MDMVEKYRFQCECRSWIKLVNKNGREWWSAMKNDLRKKRGADGLQKLLDGMELERARMRSDAGND